MGCDALREVAPEVALGLLTGEERAEALAHLQGCEACRAVVASLAGAADELLLAAPEATPPPGFKEAVLALLAAEAADVDARSEVGSGAEARRRPVGVGNITGSRPPGGRVRRRAMLLGAAALVAVVVGFGVAAVAGEDGGSDVDVATAEIRTGRGRVVGQATASGDPATVTLTVPGWAEMVERWAPEAGDSSYWLAVELEDGERAMQEVVADRESWSVDVDGPAEEVIGVSVLDGEGRVWCSGRFT
jgi:hypothetical protein